MVDTAQHSAASSGQLRCIVVTPEKAILDAVTDFVALPMFDGELGVLPGRLPLIGRLGYGELRVGQGAHALRYFVDGGFAQVRSDVVTVLTARATKASDINVTAAQNALEQALATPTMTPEAQEANDRAQQRARAQLRIAGATPTAGAAHH